MKKNTLKSFLDSVDVSTDGKHRTGGMVFQVMGSVYLWRCLFIITQKTIVRAISAQSFRTFQVSYVLQIF